MIQIQVPARICFFGDHQDYLGLPVIAGSIDCYINLNATPNQKQSFVLKLLDLGKEVSIPLNDDLTSIQKGDYFRSGMAVLRQKGFLFDTGYDIEISGNIPLNAGLSSSSALVVAWIRFLVAIQNPTTEEITDFQIGHWAYESEVVFFGQPGGLMDQYSIAQGGLLFIDTQSGKSSPLVPNLGTLIVAESGLAKQTLRVLKNAREYAQNALKIVQENHPKFVLKDATLEDYEKYKSLVPDEFQAHWYATIHNYHITKEAKKELLKPNPNSVTLGNLMNQHQTILEEKIQNTPSEMMTMMKAARKSGALGTKIIGSGGGGCMVAMVNDNTKEQVIEAFLANGAKAAYEINLTNFSK
ncbi:MULTISPECIES: GHMP kinase [Flavobacteriaceae]|uniref:GHMP family kinase ATP-binding protein n=1 Tax=Flavobacteriaceae TaxID=49546 RepID=UPI00149272B0|nr:MULTISPECIES: GHMP kinase [Allomuricauda]MDC6366029.1 GHMP kinase [Muricauda sp. AC10]